MTFQEAYSILTAEAGTNDRNAVNKAISAVKWYEDNVLELEDYETDQLYRVLDKINKLEGNKEIMPNKKVILTKSQLRKVGSDLQEIMRIIQMQNDIIDAMKHLNEIPEENIAFEYMRVYKAQDNIFYLNHDIIDKLDTYAALLSSSTEQDEVNAMLETL